MMAYTFVNMNY